MYLSHIKIDLILLYRKLNEADLAYLTINHSNFYISGKCHNSALTKPN